MKYNWRLAVSARRLKRPATEEGHGILPFPEIEVPRAEPNWVDFQISKLFFFSGSARLLAWRNRKFMAHKDYYYY